MAQPRFHLGPAEPAFRLGYITLMLKNTAPQQSALEQLLEEQQNPASPNYHDWLTPEQYADRFGLSQNDLDRISAWLQSEGFIVEYTARGRNWLAFSGTAGQVRAAFHTEIQRYRVDGESHFAAAAEPSVPASLAPVVAGFLGLDDFYPKAPRRPLPAYTDGSGLHSLAPDDIATIYDIGKLYQANMNGAGQSIVVVGQSAIDTADITGFRNKYNLPALSLQTKAFPADPGTTGDMGEGDLDLEWAGAVARNATLIYVYGSSAFDAAVYAIDNNLAPVISQSFGICELQVNRSLSSYYQGEALKASSEGITWLAASGDNGAGDCGYEGYVTRYLELAVDFPASIPEVTAVGGTEFTDQSAAAWNTTNGPSGGSAISYIPEMAWNDTSPQSGLAATGGGASSLYPKPSWQTGAGVPNDRARDLPDLSLAAGLYNPYNVLSEGSWSQMVGPRLPRRSSPVSSRCSITTW
jgi:subtilase family serine protease